MELRGGLATELNQANNITAQGLAQQSNIDVMNNLKTRDYNDAVNKAKENFTSGTAEDEKNAFEKLGEYGVQVGDKYSKYNDFIKEGGDLSGLRSTKIVSGVGSAFGKAGQGIKSAISGPAKPSIDGIEVSGTEMTGTPKPATPAEPLPQEQVAQHTTPSEPPSSETGEVNVSGDTEAPPSSTTSTTLKEGESATEEGLEEGASIGGKIAGKVAKVSGGLFSVGVLGSDIYSQVKNKSFFYGENTGDKVGNFMGEMGSVADVMGVATGDPLLAIAGVGLGAVGSVVSDISELFHHHDATPPPPTEPPPKKIIAGAVQNIASSGQVAEAQTSTAR